MGLAETFKALSDPVRREILMLLRKGKMSAGEIAAHFEMTTSVFEEIMMWIAQFSNRQEQQGEEKSGEPDDRA